MRLTFVTTVVDYQGDGKKRNKQETACESLLQCTNKFTAPWTLITGLL